MINPENTLILIPARMQASRLPGKPMALIGSEPMIVHCWRQARAANAGRVVVATDTEQIAAAVESAGGEAQLTRPDHQSGSDRIAEALDRIDPAGNVEVIVNLQGDLPTLDPALVSTCLAPLIDCPAEGPPVDIATLAATITDPEERTNPNVVKVVGTPAHGNNGTSSSSSKNSQTRLRALYFTRATAPHGDGPLYHHIGIYAYTRAALKRFIALPPSPLEKREKLEQLRALEAGMRIDVTVVDTVPLGVDTPADLDRARKLTRHAP